MFDYVFAENGLTAYKLGKQLPSESFIAYIGEERYKKLANFILHYIADLNIPIKRCVPAHIHPYPSLLRMSLSVKSCIADVGGLLGDAVARSLSSGME